jgi:hypothetical protein
MVGANRFSAPACVVAARMTDASDDKRYFLVSYNKADRAWAEWVGSSDQLAPVRALPLVYLPSIHPTCQNSVRVLVYLHKENTGRS